MAQMNITNELDHVSTSSLSSERLFGPSLSTQKFGGIIDESLGWLTNGDKLVVIFLPDGSILHQSHLPFPGSITSVACLKRPNWSTSYPLSCYFSIGLSVGTENNDIINAGGIALYDPTLARIIDCILLPSVVLKVSIAHIHDDCIIVHSLLRCWDAIVCCGTDSDEVYAVGYDGDQLFPKLREWDSSKTNSRQLSIRLEIDSNLDDRLSSLNDVAESRKQLLLVFKCNSERATALILIPHSELVAIGFMNRYILIKSLLTGESIYECVAMPGPIISFSCQCPEDDPRANLYLWSVSGSGTNVTNGHYNNQDADDQQLTFQLLQIVFASKECNLYLQPTSCNVRLRHHAGMGCRFVNMHSVLNPACSYDDHKLSDTVETTILNNSTFMFCSYLDNEKLTTCLFDLNGWYHAQMPDRFSDFAKFVTKNQFSNDQVDQTSTLSAYAIPSTFDRFSNKFNHSVLSEANAISFNIFVLNVSNLFVYRKTTLHSQVLSHASNNCSLFLEDCAHRYEVQKVIFVPLLSSAARHGLMPLVTNCYQFVDAKLVFTDIFSLIFNHSFDRDWIINLLKRCFELSNEKFEVLLSWLWDMAVDIRNQFVELHDGVTSTTMDNPVLTKTVKLTFCRLLMEIVVIRDVFDHTYELLAFEIEPYFAEKRDQLLMRLHGVELISIYMTVVEWFVVKQGVDQNEINKVTIQKSTDGERMINLIFGSELGKRVLLFWQQHCNYTDGYPVQSFNILFCVYLIDDVSLQLKHAIVLYFLLDFAFAKRIQNISVESADEICWAFGRTFLNNKQSWLFDFILACWYYDHDDNESCRQFFQKAKSAGAPKNFMIMDLLEEKLSLNNSNYSFDMTMGGYSDDVITNSVSNSRWSTLLRMPLTENEYKHACDIIQTCYGADTVTAFKLGRGQFTDAILAGSSSQTIGGTNNRQGLTKDSRSLLSAMVHATERAIPTSVKNILHNKHSVVLQNKLLSTATPIAMFPHHRYESASHQRLQAGASSLPKPLSSIFRPSSGIKTKTEFMLMVQNAVEDLQRSAKSTSTPVSTFSRKRPGSFVGSSIKKQKIDLSKTLDKLFDCSPLEKSRILSTSKMQRCSNNDLKRLLATPPSIMKFNKLTDPRLQANTSYDRHSSISGKQPQSILKPVSSAAQYWHIKSTVDSSRQEGDDEKRRLRFDLPDSLTPSPQQWTPSPLSSVHVDRDDGTPSPSDTSSLAEFGATPANQEFRSPSNQQLRSPSLNLQLEQTRSDITDYEESFISAASSNNDDDVQRPEDKSLHFHNSLGDQFISDDNDRSFFDTPSKKHQSVSFVAKTETIRQSISTTGLRHSDDCFVETTTKSTTIMECPVVMMHSDVQVFDPLEDVASPIVSRPVHCENSNDAAPTNDDDDGGGVDDSDNDNNINQSLLPPPSEPIYDSVGIPGLAFDDADDEQSSLTNVEQAVNNESVSDQVVDSCHEVSYDQDQLVTIESDDDEDEAVAESSEKDSNIEESMFDVYSKNDSSDDDQYSDSGGSSDEQTPPILFREHSSFHRRQEESEDISIPFKQQQPDTEPLDITEDDDQIDVSVSQAIADDSNQSDSEDDVEVGDKVVMDEEITNEIPFLHQSFTSDNNDAADGNNDDDLFDICFDNQQSSMETEKTNTVLEPPVDYVQEEKEATAGSGLKDGVVNDVMPNVIVTSPDRSGALSSPDGSEAVLCDQPIGVFNDVIPELKVPSPCDAETVCDEPMGVVNDVMSDVKVTSPGDVDAGDEPIGAASDVMSEVKVTSPGDVDAGDEQIGVVNDVMSEVKVTSPGDVDAGDELIGVVNDVMPELKVTSPGDAETVCDEPIGVVNDVMPELKVTSPGDAETVCDEPMGVVNDVASEVKVMSQGDVEAVFDEPMFGIPLPERTQAAGVAHHSKIDEPMKFANEKDESNVSNVSSIWSVTDHVVSPERDDQSPHLAEKFFSCQVFGTSSGVFDHDDATPVEVDNEVLFEEQSTPTVDVTEATIDVFNIGSDHIDVADSVVDEVLKCIPSESTTTTTTTTITAAEEEYNVPPQESVAPSSPGFVVSEPIVSPYQLPSIFEDKTGPNLYLNISPDVPLVEGVSNDGSLPFDGFDETDETDNVQRDQGPLVKRLVDETTERAGDDVDDGDVEKEQNVHSEHDVMMTPLNEAGTASNNDIEMDDGSKLVIIAGNVSGFNVPDPEPCELVSPVGLDDDSSTIIGSTSASMLNEHITMVVVNSEDVVSTSSDVLVLSNESPSLVVVPPKAGVRGRRRGRPAKSTASKSTEPSIPPADELHVDSTTTPQFLKPKQSPPGSYRPSSSSSVHSNESPSLVVVPPKAGVRGRRRGRPAKSTASKSTEPSIPPADELHVDSTTTPQFLKPKQSPPGSYRPSSSSSESGSPRKSYKDSLKAPSINTRRMTRGQQKTMSDNAPKATLSPTSPIDNDSALNATGTVALNDTSSRRAQGVVPRKLRDRRRRDSVATNSSALSSDSTIAPLESTTDHEGSHVASSVSNRSRVRNQSEISSVSTIVSVASSSHRSTRSTTKPGFVAQNLEGSSTLEADDVLPSGPFGLPKSSTRKKRTTRSIAGSEKSDTSVCSRYSLRSASKLPNTNELIEDDSSSQKTFKKRTQGKKKS